MCARMIALGLVLSGVTLVPHPANADAVGGFRSGCIGDCNDDEQVTVDEIILAVRITLGGAPASACPNGGLGVTINGLTTAVLNTLAGCAALRDFSGFSQFALRQQQHYGFCPRVGDLYSASIRATDGGWILSRSVVDRGTQGVDECLEDFSPGPLCLVARAEPCRTLTDAELERVRTGFRQVKIWTAADAFCLHGVDDPCLVTGMQWDDFSTSNFIHGSARLDGAEVPRIVELISSLGEGPETACPEP